MTAAYARQDRALSAKLAIINLLFTAAVVLPATAFFVAFGPALLGVVSSGRLHAGRSLFAWLAITAGLQAIWSTIAQFLFAINKQQDFAYPYIVLTAITVIAPLFVGESSVVIRASTVWCIAEGLMLLHVYRVWRRQSDITYADFRKGTEEVLSQVAITLQLLKRARVAAYFRLRK
jgi:O-antigen/teichoic acid export membrane protein